MCVCCARRLWHQQHKKRRVEFTSENGLAAVAAGRALNQKEEEEVWKRGKLLALAPNNHLYHQREGEREITALTQIATKVLQQRPRKEETNSK